MSRNIYQSITTVNLFLERPFLKPDIVLAEVVSNTELASGIFLIKFKAPYLAENACPGSFVMIKPDNGTDPLLRRPFTICGISGDVVEVLFQVKGSGTDIMSKWKPGRIVDILGPLGNGFSISPNLKNAYLVGGGMGIAPLLFLARTLNNKGVNVKIFYGSRSVSETIIIEDQILANVTSTIQQTMEAKVIKVS